MSGKAEEKNTGLPKFTEIKEKAARLLAEDVLADHEIAEQCGVSRTALAKWKKKPGFAARVEEIKTAYSERALRHGLAKKERRVSVLNDLHDRMLRVIEERSQDEEYSEIPGGKTGLVTKNLKGIGKGDDFQVVEVYEVDTGTLKEIRATQEQVAKELGQWTEKRTISFKRPEDMTDDELRAFIGDESGSSPRASETGTAAP